MGIPNDWLYLIGWVSGSIIFPLHGMWCWLSSVIAHWAPISRYLFFLNGLALTSVARGLFKTLIPGMHGVYLSDQSSSIVRCRGTCLYTHRQYCADLFHWLHCDYRHLMHVSRLFHDMRVYHVIPCFHYSSFVHLLGCIWDPGFACPDIDLVFSPSEGHQEYIDVLAEQQ